MDIQIIKFGSLGDVIRTSYILPGLYDKFNKPKIYWFTSASSFDLLRFNPYIFGLYTPWLGMDNLAGAEMFDLVISLDDEAEILKIVDTVKHREVIGAHLSEGVSSYTENAREWFDMGLISRFGKEKADEMKKKNTREHNEILASMLEIDIKEPIFFNSPVIEGRMSGRFDRTYFGIGINSGAGSRWASKQLPVEETIKLIERILSIEIDGKKTAVYLLGGEKEKERHSTIKRALASERIVDTGNANSLLEFAAIVKCCDYVITSDSLALHMAISQRVKNLSFYAPTSATEIGTFGYGVKVTSLSDDYCSYRKDADNSSITAGRILETMKKHLGVEG